MHTFSFDARRFSKKEMIILYVTQSRDGIFERYY